MYILSNVVSNTIVQQAFYLLNVLLAQFAFGDEAYGLLAVKVGAGNVVEAVVQKPMGFLLHCRAIAAGKGSKVELEFDALAVQLGIFCIVQVYIPLGVCKQGLVAQ